MVIKVISVLAKLEYDTPLSISLTLARAQKWMNWLLHLTMFSKKLKLIIFVSVHFTEIVEFLLEQIKVKIYSGFWLVYLLWFL